MAKTNAERQRAYRARHLHDIDGGGERINTVIKVSAKRSLERLTACYGVTQREMIERLIADAQTKVLRKLTPAQQERYYDRTLGALRSNN